MWHLLKVAKEAIVEEVIYRQCINILRISSTVPQCDVFSLMIVDSSATLALKKSSAVLNKSAQYAALVLTYSSNISSEEGMFVLS